MFSDNREIREI